MGLLQRISWIFKICNVSFHLAVEAQAIDRVHRIGQKRAVNAYRFIAKNTVEEKILELQQSKKNISSEIFSEKSDMIKDLTVMDIENIFS